MTTSPPTSRSTAVKPSPVPAGRSRPCIPRAIPPTTSAMRSTKRTLSSRATTSWAGRRRSSPRPTAIWATTWRSLQAVRDRDFATLWPTHGAPVREVAPFIDAYAAHRREREAQILAELAAGTTRIEWAWCPPPLRGGGLSGSAPAAAHRLQRPEPGSRQLHGTGRRPSTVSFAWWPDPIPPRDRLGNRSQFPSLLDLARGRVLEDGPAMLGLEYRKGQALLESETSTSPVLARIYAVAAARRKSADLIVVSNSEGDQIAVYKVPGEPDPRTCSERPPARLGNRQAAVKKPLG